ncbi:MAG: hypothetical protein V8R51_06290 [Clostridia bacterium]
MKHGEFIQENNLNKILDNLNAKYEEIKILQNEKEKITQDCRKLLNKRCKNKIIGRKYGKYYKIY